MNPPNGFPPTPPIIPVHWVEWVTLACAIDRACSALNEADAFLFCRECEADTVDPGHERWCSLGRSIVSLYACGFAPVRNGWIR